MRVYRTKGGYFYKELKNGKKTRISKEQYQKLRKTQTGKGWFSKTHNVTGNNGVYTCSCGKELGENPTCPNYKTDQQMCQCSQCSGHYGSYTAPKVADYLCRCCGKNFNINCLNQFYTTWATIDKKCGQTRTWKAINLTKTGMSSKYSGGQYKICAICNNILK